MATSLKVLVASTQFSGAAILDPGLTPPPSPPPPKKNICGSLFSSFGVLGVLRVLEVLRVLRVLRVLGVLGDLCFQHTQVAKPLSKMLSIHPSSYPASSSAIRKEEKLRESICVLPSKIKFKTT